MCYIAVGEREWGGRNRGCQRHRGEDEEEEKKSEKRYARWFFSSFQGFRLPFLAKERERERQKRAWSGLSPSCIPCFFLGISGVFSSSTPCVL